MQTCARILLLTSSLLLDLPAPKPTPPTTTQKSEIIYGKRCHITITPGADFILHIPLTDAGSLDEKRIYTTGHVHFSIEPTLCGEIRITKE